MTKVAQKGNHEKLLSSSLFFFSTQAMRTSMPHNCAVLQSNHRTIAHRASTSLQPEIVKLKDERG